MSEIVAAVFMILIIFVAFAVFTTMFNSFVSYQQQADRAESQLAQNQQTSLSASMQFGSPEIASGSSNPPTFNVNSIATATVQTHYPTERKVVYSQGLWWAFYSSGTAIVYQTSSDGITWSATATLTSATGSTLSYEFSVWLGSSATLYFVLSTFRTVNTFTLGSVPLQSGGTIGTVTTATITMGTGYDAESYASITNDTSGNIWVAISVHHTTAPADGYVQVERCTAALVCTAMDGTAPPTITLATPNGDSLFPEILRLNDVTGGEDMAVVYSDAGSATTGGPFNTAEVVSIQTCTGGTAAADCQGTAPATWSTRVSTTSTFYPDLTSAVSIGNTVYFAGATATSIATWSLAFGSATVPTVYTIDSTVTGTAAPVSISEYYVAGNVANVLGY